MTNDDNKVPIKRSWCPNVPTSWYNLKYLVIDLKAVQQLPETKKVIVT